MRSMGVRIEQPSATRLRVHGVGLHGLQAAAHALDMGNAGTAIRLFTGLLAAQRFDSQLIGDESLMQRPMERVAKPLREMGAEVRTRNGTPPIDISGGRRLQRHRIPHAGGERPGEIGHPPCRPLCGRCHHRHLSRGMPRSQRADARRLRRTGREPGPRRPRFIHPIGSKALRSRCPETSPPPHFSSSPGSSGLPGRDWCCKTWD